MHFAYLGKVLQLFQNCKLGPCHPDTHSHSLPWKTLAQTTIFSPYLIKTFGSHLSITVKQARKNWAYSSWNGMARGGGLQIRESYVTTSSTASWRDSRDLGDQEEIERRREESVSGQLFEENDEKYPSQRVDESSADRTELNEVVWLKHTKFAPVSTVWLDICLLQLKSLIFAVMVWSWASTFGRSLTGGP